MMQLKLIEHFSFVQINNPFAFLQLNAWYFQQILKNYWFFKYFFNLNDSMFSGHTHSLTMTFRGADSKHNLNSVEITVLLVLWNLVRICSF